MSSRFRAKNSRLADQSAQSTQITSCTVATPYAGDVRCATYRKGQRQHPDATLAEASTALHAGAVDFVWLHLTDPTAATRKRVAAELGAGHALDRDGSSQDAAALAGEESAEFARFVVGFPQFVAGNRPQVTEHGS